MPQDISATEPQELIKQQVNLPSPPAVAVQILNTVQNAECSLDDLERIISADPALTSKMLRIANSAFYSLPQEVRNISRALSVLGTNVIKNIALSFVIAGDLRDPKGSNFDFNHFWRRSVTAAVAAEILNQEIKVKDENIFVTALLQDIGILVIAQSKGESYRLILDKIITTTGTGLIDPEQKLYNFDHQQIGHLLLLDWGIPQVITEPIRFHHTPELASEEVRTTAQVLNIANLLSAIYSGTETAENVRELQVKMEEYFDIPTSRTTEILDEVAIKSVDILNIFELDPGQIKPYSQILQEANDELGKLNLSYEQLVLELKESKEKSERFANDLRQANAKLEELAFRDGLTNLYNHRYFQEVLTTELQRAERYNRPLSLVLFDIDFFKKVNDTYGHPAGDQVLVNLAKVMSAAVRPSDIVARYGGEEFAVILPETSINGLKVFAERLRRSAESATTIIGDKQISITISCGGAHYAPTETPNKQQLIDIADQGLYQSKSNGRNRVTILPLVTSS